MNAEYVPTDDEAREWYANGRFNDGLGDYEGESFDRWLVAHDAAIWDAGKVAGIIQVTAAPGTYDPAHVENPYRPPISALTPEKESGDECRN